MRFLNLLFLCLIAAGSASAQQRESAKLSYQIGGAVEYGWTSPGYPQTSAHIGLSGPGTMPLTGCDNGRQFAGNGFTSQGTNSKISLKVDQLALGAAAPSGTVISTFRFRICAGTSGNFNPFDSSTIPVRPYVRDIATGQIWEASDLDINYAFHVRNNVGANLLTSHHVPVDFGPTNNTSVTVLDIPVWTNARNTNGQVRLFEVGLVDASSTSTVRPRLYRMDVSVVTRDSTAFKSKFSTSVTTTNVISNDSAIDWIPVTTATGAGYSPTNIQVNLLGDTGMFRAPLNKRIEVTPVAAVGSHNGRIISVTSGDSFALKVQGVGLAVNETVGQKVLLVMEGANGEVNTREIHITLTKTDPVNPPPPPSGLPPAPAFLTVERIANNGTLLTWSRVTSATSYEVRGEVGGVTQFVNTVMQQSGTPFFTDNRPYALTNNSPQTAITYRVFSINANGKSELSANEFCQIFVPSAPGVC